MSKIFTTRLPDEYVIEIKKIAEIENLDSSAVLRKLLSKAFKEWRLKYALEQYKEGKFSFGQLANFAGISVWDVPRTLKENKIPLNYDVEEFNKDLETLKKWK